MHNFVINSSYDDLMTKLTAWFCRELIMGHNAHNCPRWCHDFQMTLRWCAGNVQVLDLWNTNSSNKGYQHFYFDDVKSSFSDLTLSWQWRCIFMMETRVSSLSFSRLVGLGTFHQDGMLTSWWWNFTVNFGDFLNRFCHDRMVMLSWRNYVVSEGRAAKLCYDRMMTLSWRNYSELNRRNKLILSWLNSNVIKMILHSELNRLPPRNVMNMSWHPHDENSQNPNPKLFSRQNTKDIKRTRRLVLIHWIRPISKTQH